jgi:hypothetical protein
MGGFSGSGQQSALICQLEGNLLMLEFTKFQVCFLMVISFSFNALVFSFD